MITIVLLLTMSVYPYCEPNTNYNELKPIIDIIKEKTNIEKIKSFYCQYTHNTDYYFLVQKLDSKNYETHKSIQGEIAWTGILGTENLENFLISELYSPTYKQIEDNPKIDGENYSSFKKEKKATNLLELIKQKLENKAIKNYTNYVSQSDLNVITIIDSSYLYKGESTNLRTLQYKDGTVKVIGPFYTVEPFPLILHLLGRIGSGLHDFDIHTWGFSIGEFLEADKEKPYYIDSKEGYTTIWHYAEIVDPNEPGSPPEKIRAEIWLDSQYNIFRIDFIAYPTRRRESLKFLEDVNYKGPIDCDTPKLLYARIELTDYMEFEKGISIPLHGIKEEYFIDIGNEEGWNVAYGYYVSNKISFEEFYRLSLQLPRKVNFRDEFIIHPETIKINQPIPKELFIPPQPDPIEQTPTKNPINKNYSWALFVSCSVIFVLFLILISKKIFGWGI